MFTLSMQINIYPRDHSHPWTGSQKPCHRQMCLHTYTLTHSLTHKTLSHSNILRLAHQYIPTHTHIHVHTDIHSSTQTCSNIHQSQDHAIDSFTQGHKCLYSKVPTHTVHYTCTLISLKIYVHIDTHIQICSHPLWSSDIHSKKKMHSQALPLMFMFHSHKYTHLFTSSQRWTWYTFIYSYKRANTHACGCKFRVYLNTQTLTAIPKYWNMNTRSDAQGHLFTLTNGQAHIYAHAPLFRLLWWLRW